MAARDTLTREIELRLGGGMIDVELDPDHYNLAITKSLEKYRQRSSQSTEESFVLMELKIDVSEYTLADEVIEVKDIYRRVTGSYSSSGNDIEPFEAAYLNTYLLHSGRAGGLATFEAYAEHREHLGKMFGSEILFDYRPQSKKLRLHRRIKADTDVVLHVYNYRPEENLIIDTYSGPWLKDYSLCQAKLMLSEARSKFGAIAGPQGGTTLNGDALRQDAIAEIDKLEQDLTLHNEGSDPLGFVIG